MNNLPGWLGSGTPVLKLDGDADTINTSTTPVVGTIPLLSSGAKAPYLALGGTLNDHVFNVGTTASVDATKGALLRTNELPGLIFSTRGRSHYAIATTVGASSDISVSPVASISQCDVPLQLGSDSVRDATIAVGGTTEILIPILSGTWHDPNEGAAVTFVDATRVSVAEIDVTAQFPTNKKVKVTHATGNDVVAFVASSSFSTNTSITLEGFVAAAPDDAVRADADGILFNDGARARFVLVNGHNRVYVRQGLTGETIHTPAIQGLRVRQDFSWCLNVTGATHILATSRDGTGRDLTVTPIEV